MANQANVFHKARPQVGFAKVGASGKQGSGKTTLLGLLALYLSKTFHSGAPVAFLDSEKGSDFLEPIFAAEGVDLLVQKSRAFDDLRNAYRNSKSAGACALITDSTTHFWVGLLAAAKAEKGVKRLSVDLIQRVKDEWYTFAEDFVTSQIHYLAAGRLGYEWENAEFQEENGKTTRELIRLGTKMKAETDFGHDFDLELELATIENPDALRYEKLKGKARKVFTANLLHCCTVKKCRVWALNGQVFRWADKPRYQAGDYIAIGQCFKPYFDFLNIGKGAPSDGNPLGDLTRRETDRAIFRADSDTPSFYRDKTAREALVGDWNGLMTVAGLAGTGKREMTMRGWITEAITGYANASRLSELPLSQLQHDVLVLAKVREHADAGELPDNITSVRSLVEMCRCEVEGEYGADRKPPATLLEFQLEKSVEQARQMQGD